MPSKPTSRLGSSLRAVALTACLPFLGASYWPTTNDAEVAKGQEAYRQGNYDAAVHAFSRAMRGHGDSDRLQFDLGTALLRSAMVAVDETERAAQLDRSIAALRSATDTRESNLRERARFNLGNALALRLRYDEAIASYREVLISNTEHHDARHNLALVLAAKYQANERGPGAHRGGQGAQDAEGQGDGQAGEHVGASTDQQPDNQHQGQGAEGTEGGDVEPGRNQRPGTGQRAQPALPPDSPLQAETSNPRADPRQERGPDNLTIVQKLEALERRSGELRRDNLLLKSRSRLRDPNKKGAEQ